jgi:hypothetical protein
MSISDRASTKETILHQVVVEARFLWHAQVFSLADGVRWEGSVDVNMAVGGMADTSPAVHEYHLSPTGRSGGDHTAPSSSDT